MSMERETASVPEMLAALKHLGGGEHEVPKSPFSVNWKNWGYSCITCEIHSSMRHHKHGPERYNIVVWWWKGKINALKDALDEAIPRSRWCTLNDDKMWCTFRDKKRNHQLKRTLESYKNV